MRVVEKSLRKLSSMLYRSRMFLRKRRGIDDINYIMQCQCFLKKQINVLELTRKCL